MAQDHYSERARTGGVQFRVALETNHSTAWLAGRPGGFGVRRSRCVRGSALVSRILSILAATRLASQPMAGLGGARLFLCPGSDSNGPALAGLGQRSLAAQTSRPEQQLLVGRQGKQLARRAILRQFENSKRGWSGPWQPDNHGSGIIRVTWNFESHSCSLTDFRRRPSQRVPGRTSRKPL